MAYRIEHDAQLEEFEKKDLGDDIAASGVPLKLIRRGKSKRTTIMLPEVMILRLRELGAEVDMGYQTFAKMLLAEGLKKRAKR